MLSSGDVFPPQSKPITSLEYRDVGGEGNALNSRSDATPTEPTPAAEGTTLYLSQDELSVRLEEARTAATQDLEQRLKREYQVQLDAERNKIAQALAGFERERSGYYSQVESELVQLALAIAGKILHREAQVDRLLLAALVKIAIENLQHRSNVRIRVRPEILSEWRDYFSGQLEGTRIEVLEDSALQPNDCVLETELGMANLNLEVQLKEIERGLFDLLAHRPDSTL